MAENVTTLVLKIDLQCHDCYRKTKKVLCKFPDIRDQVYDEKANTVTIRVVRCNPEEIRYRLLCDKDGKVFKSIEIKEETPKTIETEKEPEKLKGILKWPKENRRISFQLEPKHGKPKPELPQVKSKETRKKIPEPNDKTVYINGVSYYKNGVSYYELGYAVPRPQEKSKETQKKIPEPNDKTVYRNGVAYYKDGVSYDELGYYG